MTTSQRLLTRRPRYREQEVQRAVIDHLRWRGQRDAYWFHVGNGGWRSPAEARVFAGLGVRPGVPDLILIRAGTTYGLELKADNGGRLSDAQRDAQEAMRLAGAIVHTAVGLDDAIGWLEQHSLLRGRAQLSAAGESSGWQRFYAELAAAPTRATAADVFHGHDFLFLGMSSAERERRYAEIEDIIREKPTEDSHCQVRVSAPVGSGKHTEREIP
jgi:hypothetical protein